MKSLSGYADDREFVREGCFKLAQLRECMHTVYSTKRPEVEDDDTTFQFTDVEWMVAINPVKSSRKIWRSYFAPI